LFWTNLLFRFSHCSALGRSAFDQILAGRWSYSVYSILKLIRLFNTAHGLDQKRTFPSREKTCWQRSGAI
jgi:hypothetical protein